MGLHKHTHSHGSSTRSVEVRRTLLLALALNLGLALLKITFAFFTGLLSLMADGFHSLSDGLSSAMAFFAMKKASQSSDEKHHYGYDKYETLATLGIATLIGVTAWEVFFHALKRVFGHGHSGVMFHPVALGVIVFTIAVNLFLAIYEHRKGRALHSHVLKADALHTASDIGVSLVVLISIVALRFGMPWVDTVCSLGISFYFAYLSYHLIAENVRVLSDAAFINVEDIQSMIQDHPDVFACSNVRTRGPENHAFVDMHIQISADMPLRQSHELVHDLENQIKSAFEGVTEVLIHTEPYEG